MIVLVANSGRLEQVTVELENNIDEKTLNLLRNKLKNTITNKKFIEVATLVKNFEDDKEINNKVFVGKVIEKIKIMVTQKSDQKIVVAGASNLAKLDSEFSKKLLPVLDEIEENVVMLKLMGEMVNEDELFIRIGHENKVPNLQSASVVSSGYITGDSLSKLGIVGPTRMDYPGTISAVRAVARYLGRILGNK